jgi:hypothetical protein
VFSLLCSESHSLKASSGAIVGAIAFFSRFANATCAILVTSSLSLKFAPKSENRQPTFAGWRSAMKRSGLGLGFVVVLLAQSFAVIIVFNWVIVGSKKKFTQRNSFGLPIATLKVLQPSLFSEPSQVHLEFGHHRSPP